MQITAQITLKVFAWLQCTCGDHKQAPTAQREREREGERGRDREKEREGERRREMGW